MKDPVSVRCHLIGACLRQYREQAGWTLKDAARLLGCDPSKIARIEAGTRGVIPGEAATLLDEYGAGPGGREALQALAAAGKARGWQEDYRDLLTPGYRDIMATEHAAVTIAIYAPVGIPELLHAESYARALAAAAGALVPAAVQAKAAAITMARQKAILTARPVQLTVILAATALRQDTGDPGAARDQAHFLAELAEAHPRVTIQLLPLTASLHAAGGSGTFTILSFSHQPSPKLVLADAPGGGTLTGHQPSVAAYERAFTQQRTLALTEHESARWLQRMASGKAGTAGTPRHAATERA